MEIFSENPKSFKIDRKSAEASNLKASVSRKLLDFLGNYSDDVLAEYIVVLVCNGKNQIQAREDLEAFLGDESGAFVTWLWSHLAENANPSTPSGSPNVKKSTVTSIYNNDDMETRRTSRSRDLQNHKTVQSDNPLSYEKKDVMISANPVEGYEDCQHSHPAFGDPVTEVNTEDEQACRTGTPDDRFDSCNEAIKFWHSRVRSSPGISAIGEQCQQYEDQHKKIVNSYYNGMPHQPLHLPKRKANLRNLQSVVTENPHSRSITTPGVGLSSRDVDVVPHHIVKPRGNVWDRLGRPCKNDAVEMGDTFFSHANEASNVKKIAHRRENFVKHNSVLVVPDDQLSKRLMGDDDFYHSSDMFVSKNHTSECRELEPSMDLLCSRNDTSISRQKRKLGEIYPGDGSVTSTRFRGRNLQDEGLSPVKHSHQLGMDAVTSDIRSSDVLLSEAARHSLQSPKAALPGAHKISHAQSKMETPMAAARAPVPASSSLPAKSALATHSESRDANYKPLQAVVLDVKLRLRQIEMEMTKLRSKQAEKKNDSKLNAQLSESTHNLSEDDIESRTVFVTNVHFAATKEALLSHFSKCGMIVRVTLLYDSVTSQPKGSAYIHFASKESVDKAVAMNGTSFFSRTLKIVRKADMRLGISAPAQPTGQPLQQRHSPSPRKGPLLRSYSSSHLQWRRGQQQNAEDSLETQAGTTEASRTHPATHGLPFSQESARTSGIIN